MNDLFEPFLRRLRADLAGPLPGQAAQQCMAPQPRPNSDLQLDPGPDSRRGGVLFLLYPQRDQVWLPLILRPTYSGVHSGQVGLPGGGFEQSDADLAATALRETYEEIGIHASQVTLLGALSPLYVFASDYIVQPFIGWTDQQPDFHPDPYEVAKLIRTPLAAFLDPANHAEEMWQMRKRDVLVPLYNIQDQVIWGATAMMLSEMLALPAIAGIGDGSSTR